MAKTKPEGLNVPLLVKLVDAMREEHGKLGSLINEFDNLLAGRATIGERMKHGMAHWDQLWSANYQGKFVWHGVRDAPQMKRLLGLIQVDELCLRMNKYFRDRGAYLVERRHPFGLFVSHINDYAVWAPGESEDAAPVVEGCLHTPTCRSDQAHTKRRQQEMLEVRD